jgi:hypothetical protein
MHSKLKASNSWSMRDASSEPSGKKNSEIDETEEDKNIDK